MKSRLGSHSTLPRSSVLQFKSNSWRWQHPTENSSFCPCLEEGMFVNHVSYHLNKPPFSFLIFNATDFVLQSYFHRCHPIWLPASPRYLYWPPTVSCHYGKLFLTMFIAGWLNAILSPSLSGLRRLSNLFSRIRRFIHCFEVALKPMQPIFTSFRFNWAKSVIRLWN